LKLISIAAAGSRNELGKDNDLIWHLPLDFKRFKFITSNHYIIMGRKTFESFPKPLPNRTHVIITKQKAYNPQNCIVVSSIQEALEKVKHQEKAYVIGGGEIYKQFMPLVDEIELTRVHGTFDADTYFPDINQNEWDLVFQEFHQKDEKHNFDFTFETYVRKKIRE
jgi:dihydrofolate reductase